MNNINSNTFCQEFEQRVAAAWDPRDWLSVPVVVGVSGGSDSVCLLRSLASIRAQHAEVPRHPLIVAHLNHGLRGEAAEDDARFVYHLADSLGLTCEIAVIDLWSVGQQLGDGLEAAARIARYDFFQKVAERYSARYVATGHTLDDQVETILHRVIRGTGPRGLAGMPRARALNASVTLIRPLLEFRREELCEYLQAINQPYCHDATNDQLHFTRNRIRNELLPLLRESYNKQVDDALLRLGTLGDEIQSLVDDQVAIHRARLAIRATSTELVVEVDRLEQVPPYLLREVLRSLWQEQAWPQQSMGFAQWDMLARLAIKKAPAAITLPGGIRAIKKDGQLVLSRPSDD